MSSFQAHSILHKIILGTGMVELQREHFQNETWFHRTAKMILRWKLINKSLLEKFSQNIQGKSVETITWNNSLSIDVIKQMFQMEFIVLEQPGRTSTFQFPNTSRLFRYQGGFDFFNDRYMFSITPVDSTGNSLRTSINLV